MQSFMMKKGIILQSMTMDELQAFLHDGSKLDDDQSAPKEAVISTKNKPVMTMSKAKAGKCALNVSPSVTSEATIYKQAVQQLAPELGEQIEQFIADARAEIDNGQTANNQRKVSSSSDELMDTSDQFEVNNLQGLKLILGPNEGKKAQLPEQTPQEHADEMVRNGEKSKARVYDMPGRDFSNNTTTSLGMLNLLAIDNDYQMVDAHVDENLKKKILNFEYGDFAKLLRNRGQHDEETRLEFVNRNAITFLSPASDRDSQLVTSHGHWEQAFRVFSNVITTSYPSKAPELLQYGHTISTAAASYHWDNVYSYDKEFRRHIECHPMRAWNIILQPAWTMLLKDRI